MIADLILCPYGMILGRDSLLRPELAGIVSIGTCVRAASCGLVSQFSKVHDLYLRA